MVPFDANPTKYSWTVVALGLGTALILGQYVYSSSAYAARRAFRRYTAVDDLSVLGRERKGPKLKGTVVIAGGRCVASSRACFSGRHHNFTPSILKYGREFLTAYIRYAKQEGAEFLTHGGENGRMKGERSLIASCIYNK